MFQGHLFSHLFSLLDSELLEKQIQSLDGHPTMNLLNGGCGTRERGLDVLWEILALESACGGGSPSHMEPIRAWLLSAREALLASLGV